MRCRLGGRFVLLFWSGFFCGFLIVLGGNGAPGRPVLGGGGGGGGVGGGEALEDEGKCADEEALEDEGRYGDEEADGVVAALGDEGKCDGEEAEVEAAVEGAEVVNKEGEAQAVPTIGAFYMHDDRFRDPENGRHGSQRF